MQLFYLSLLFEDFSKQKYLMLCGLVGTVKTSEKGVCSYHLQAGRKSETLKLIKMNFEAMVEKIKINQD